MFVISYMISCIFLLNCIQYYCILFNELGNTKLWYCIQYNNMYIPDSLLPDKTWRCITYTGPWINFESTDAI